MTRFVSDARLPLDNNRSEAALRKAALGRKNFLFVGHEAAGENLADLYALVATCEANGVNPEEYLADMLLRVQTHPPRASVSCYLTSGCGDAPPTRPSHPSSPVPEPLAPRGARRARPGPVSSTPTRHWPDDYGRAMMRRRR